MGQKVNPIGFRLGVNRDWRSRWYASPQDLPEFLHSDLEIRNYVKKKLQYAAVSKIVIERAWNSIRVTIFTARPGIVIGRKGAEIEKMTEEISKMARGKQVKIDIQEIKTPELDAQLVAENVALQIERRIAYRRAMKKAVQTAMDFGAEGIRLRCSGRLNGAEISRSEWYREGKVPLHTLRTAVDYGFAEANTVYGKIGVKCWICKKDEPPVQPASPPPPPPGQFKSRRNFMPLMPKREVSKTSGAAARGPLRAISKSTLASSGCRLLNVPGSRIRNWKPRASRSHAI
jgi:small subunit ribosomal protein S3